MSKSTCTAPDCTDEARIGGMCIPHSREKFGITEDFSFKKSFEERFWENVETGPACWEWLGSTAKGYGRIGRGTDTVIAHRYSYEYHNGPIPDGLFIDHKCHNPGCVNPDHLRAVTPKQNTEHRAGGKPNSTSGGVHGVHWSKSAKKWQATVHAGHKVHHVGYFTDLEEAAEAARLKRNELFTHNDKDRKAA